MLDTLRQKNPGLRLFSVLDPEFAPYGRVLRLAGEDALAEALAGTPIPESGNCYRAAASRLKNLEAVKDAAQTVFGGMPVQAGYCNGRGFTLNAEEYHKCSEVNYSTTGLVLLLALPENLRDRTLDSADVVGFYLPAGVAVEIRPLVLHFAPCRIREDGFNCLVILQKGTNGVLEHIDTSAEGEEALLWMVNKWMVCHPDSPQAQKGAFVGIRGENLKLII